MKVQPKRLSGLPLALLGDYGREIDPRHAAYDSVLPIDRRTLLGGFGAATLVLTGCAGAPLRSPQPMPQSGAATATSAAQTSGQHPESAQAAPADALAVEQQWLLSFFSGTPVDIQRTDDGALVVTVPAEFCFYAKATIIKPPLAAVLNKVALSLRRLPLARVTLIAAPPDPGSSSNGLAGQRAKAIAKRFRSFGILAERLVAGSAAADANVRLAIQNAPV